ncbi:hypothetical protein HWV62_10695 [Athelia sp. TMB]|nr:hypothetical protein HWV62_10695 [Athelia sp. TMB]
MLIRPSVLRKMSPEADISTYDTRMTVKNREGEMDLLAFIPEAKVESLSSTEMHIAPSTVEFTSAGELPPIQAAVTVPGTNSSYRHSPILAVLGTIGALVIIGVIIAVVHMISFLVKWVARKRNKISNGPKYAAAMSRASQSFGPTKPCCRNETPSLPHVIDEPADDDAQGKPAFFNSAQFAAVSYCQQTYSTNPLVAAAQILAQELQDPAASNCKRVSPPINWHALRPPRLPRTLSHRTSYRQEQSPPRKQSVNHDSECSSLEDSCKMDACGRCRVHSIAFSHLEDTISERDVGVWRREGMDSIGIIDVELPGHADCHAKQ